MINSSSSPSLDILLSIDKCNNKPCSNKVVTRSIDILHGDKRTEFHRVCCNKWLCQICGPRKKKHLYELIFRAVKENDLTRFLILTQNPNSNDDIEAQCKNIMYSWAKFRVYLRRKFNASVSYFWVLERHKNRNSNEYGSPHLHIFIDRYIPQRWISRIWDKVGGGKITFIRKLKEYEIPNKVDYVLKHFDTWDRYNLPFGTRRYGYSKGLIKKPDNIKSDWKFTRGAVDELYDRFLEDVVEERHDQFGNLISFVIIEGPNVY